MNAKMCYEFIVCDDPMLVQIMNDKRMQFYVCYWIQFIVPFIDFLTEQAIPMQFFCTVYCAPCVCMRIVRENKLDICTYCLENVEIRVHADWLAMDRVGSLDVVVRAEMARCVQILRLLAVVQALRPFEFAIDLVHALLQLHLIPNMKVVDSLSRPDSLAELLALVGSVHSDANHSVRFSIF